MTDFIHELKLTNFILEVDVFVVGKMRRTDYQVVQAVSVDVGGS